MTLFLVVAAQMALIGVIALAGQYWIDRQEDRLVAKQQLVTLLLGVTALIFLASLAAWAIRLLAAPNASFSWPNTQGLVLVVILWCVRHNLGRTIKKRRS